VALGADGAVASVEIVPSFVAVRRASYQQADGLLGSGPLAALDAVARTREAYRAAGGAVDIDIPETRVWVDRSSGKPEPRVESPPKARSQTLVRELMVLGGEAAARWAFERDLPFPYYSQEAPSDSGGLPEGLAGEFAKRRLMRGGMAGTLPRAHRGLGVSFYAQATSPLRRYADLLAHRQIRAALGGRDPLPADEVSERLARAAAAGALLRQAERASEAHWTLAWLADRPGVELDGVVVGLGSWGLAVFVPAIGLETRVKGPELALNAAVRLKLVGVDLPKRDARFSLA
jgi:exoribonuclease-2